MNFFTLKNLLKVTFTSSGLLLLIFLWKAKDYSVNPIPTLKPQVPEPIFKQPITLYSQNKQQICPKYTNLVENEENKSLSDFSPYLIQALLASEDRRYFWHLGIDPIGLSRAVLARGSQGGSTITMQLARTLYPSRIGRDRTLSRKFKEASVALKLEFVYGKDKILKTYLNRVFLGGGLYGFEKAAQYYFGKSAAFLTLGESATLVSLLPAPNSLTPSYNHEDLETAIKNRNIVIQNMLALKMISREEAEQAKISRLEFRIQEKNTVQVSGGYYCDYLINQDVKYILPKDTINRGNLIIETTLDIKAQKLAESELRNFINNIGKTKGFSQGALVTLNTKTGEIIALVGGKDYYKDRGNIDRATNADQQPGSTFKVFTYIAALQQGISPTTLLSCKPLEWDGYSYKGCRTSSNNISLQDALIYSENAPSILLVKSYLGEDGLSKVLNLATKFDITSELKKEPALVIGGNENTVSLLEMTGAYATLANKGLLNRTHGIAKVWDAKQCTNPKDINTCKQPIFDFTSDEKSEQILSTDVATTMTNILQRAVQQGTGKSAFLGLGEAGKTGTTDGNADLWFIGYIPERQLVTGIWLGNDNNQKTNASSKDAAQLWAEYMSKLVKER